MKFFVFLIICLMLLPSLGSAQSCVDINTGSLAQLEELDGIGPTKAQAIIDSRPYSSIDDLDRAKGIGSATLAKIKTQGLASVSCQTQTNQTTQTQLAQLAESGTPPASPAPPTTTPSSGEVGAPPIYPTGIFINEILPNPEGSDEANEWIVSTIQRTGTANSAYS